MSQSYPILGESGTPINVFSFSELDLGLDAIPSDDLDPDYRAEAAITADFTGLYIDAEQYNLLENSPAWKLNRLRFTGEIVDYTFDKNTNLIRKRRDVEAGRSH